MQPEIYSQAARIANGDPDLKQNILAMAFQNDQNAKSRGKELSIGEQVNFMKYRAGNLKSGTRYDFGHAHYKASKDVFAKRLYFQGDVEIHHIHYEDDAEHEESPENGKGHINGALSKVNLEDECLLAIDLENFTNLLPVLDREILVRRMAGFNYTEIAEVLKCSTFRVKSRYREICFHMLMHMDIRRAIC